MLKKIGFVSIVLFIFGFSATLMGNEWANYYFPEGVGSYWTYQDQDGNALTRYAVEPEKLMAKPIKLSVMIHRWKIGRILNITSSPIFIESATNG